LWRGERMPQGSIKFIIRGAPHHPIAPKPRLRLAYSGAPIVRTPADVLAIIRRRTADILTDAEIAIVIRLPAIEGPPKPTPAKRQKKARPRARKRGKDGRLAPGGG
jgi:hypothetical protein